MFMLTIAGQTARPYWLKNVNGTNGYPGGVDKLIFEIWDFFIFIFFLQIIILSNLWF